MKWLRKRWCVLFSMTRGGTDAPPMIYGRFWTRDGAFAAARRVEGFARMRLALAYLDESRWVSVEHDGGQVYVCEVRRG